MKTWISWEVIGTSMFTKASTFLGSITFPSLDTMKPRRVPANTINMHFFGFRLIPNFLHFINFLLEFLKVSWHVIENYKVVKKYFHEYMNVHMKHFSCLLISGWSIFYTKWHHNPHKIPPNLSQRWFCLDILMQIKYHDILKIHPKGINLIHKRQHVRIFFVSTLSFLKSTQLLNFPFFSRTTTIDDSQIASSTSLI